jgi:hypothetical protein
MSNSLLLFDVDALELIPVEVSIQLLNEDPNEHAAMCVSCSHDRVWT